MKQTAVDFYSQEEIKLTLEFLDNKITQLEYGIKKLRLVEQAKQMEKEQIIESFKQGIAYWNGDEWKLIDIEAYYNQTFKTK